MQGWKGVVIKEEKFGNLSIIIKAFRKWDSYNKEYKTKYITISVETTFDAAHWLPNYEGKCSQLHGHAWRVKAEIGGYLNEETGMLVDFSKVKNILRLYDRDCLNIPKGKGEPFKNPTAENIADRLANKILKLGDNIKSVRLTLWETKNNCVIIEK